MTPALSVFLVTYRAMTIVFDSQPRVTLAAAVWTCVTMAYLVSNR
jgi:hypothetical protein